VEARRERRRGRRIGGQAGGNGCSHLAEHVAWGWFVVPTQKAGWKSAASYIGDCSLLQSQLARRLRVPSINVRFTPIAAVCSITRRSRRLAPVRASAGPAGAAAPAWANSRR
jgi:hypothetical protein